MSHFLPSLFIVALRITLVTLAAFGAASLPIGAAAQVISTVVGGGTSEGYDVFTAVPPIGYLAVSPSGEIHFSSSGRIFKIGKDGTQVLVAGNGTWPFLTNGDANGDGGVARNAAIGYGDFCIDAQGNIYVADDSSNYRIRKVATDGRISTFAGTGARGSAGDGGQAMNAQLSEPRGIVMNTVGDFYFLDGYTRVRKITGTGIITTAASWSGVTGFAGDGENVSNARFSDYISDLAVDHQGNIYLADRHNHRIRRIAREGLVSTVAGNGHEGVSGDGGPATSAALSFPTFIAIDGTGNLYFTSRDHRIRKVSVNGIISTVAGANDAGFSGDGGPAANAKLNGPGPIAVDAVGNLYINDYFNGRVRKVTADGKISTIIGKGYPPYYGDGNLSANATLNVPRSPVFDTTGNMYVVDGGNRIVRKISPSGRISTIAGNGRAGNGGDGGDAQSASFMDPVAAIADASGNVFIADAQANLVRKVTPAGIISTFAGGGPFIASTPTGPVYTNGDGGPANNAVLNYPYSLAWDSEGNLYIGCSLSIRKVTPNGIISSVIGGGSWGFGGDGGPASQAQITVVEGMLVDPAGNLIFVDSMNARIRKISPAGIISTVAGNGTFGFGGDGGSATSAAVGRLTGNIALDRSGSLYFSDQNNNRVRKISPNGIISTLAGSGARGFSGDGDLALGANMNNPSGVTIDANGDLFVADSFNNRVRKISSRGGANYSDMWWAGTAENGWGMSIQQHASGVQFNALYVYDSAGQPRWYVMPGGVWSDGFTSYSGPLYQPSGNPLNQYQASAFEPGIAVGAATVRFSGSNQVADLSYTIDGLSGSKRLSRMAFGASNAGLDVGDMWWGGNIENGWGVSIAQQGSTLFSVWYTYGKDGKSTWFTMPGGSWSNNVYTGGFYATQGSRWLGAAYDPAAFRVEQIGTLGLRFSGPNAAILEYSFTSGPFIGTTQSKTLIRMGY